MTPGDLHAPGVVELYFYGELDPAEHARLEEHLTACAECRRVVEDLHTIRVALAGRPEVTAPPGGDWAPFMARLDEAVRREAATAVPAIDTGRGGGMHRTSSAAARHTDARPSAAAYLAMAALLALVTFSVVIAWRTAERAGGVLVEKPPAEGTATAGFPTAAPAADPAFVALSEQHFERSKLVVLGLTTKDPAGASGADWEYERELAASLLNDTRLYRLAAEERGLTSLARVMEDLELVLLQTSMSDRADARALEQLQRVIRKRDLVTKIELVATTAGI